MNGRLRPPIIFRAANLNKQLNPKCKDCDAPARVNSKGRSMGRCPEHYSIHAKRNLIHWSEHQDVIYISANGYVNRRLTSGQRISEHRYQMQIILGRELLPGESVHHKNGIKIDNRHENLELWVGKIRHGQRATDVLCNSCGISYWDKVTRKPSGTGWPE